MLAHIRLGRNAVCVLLAALAALLVAPHFLPQYVVILLTQSLVYAIVAMSLDVLG